MNGTMGFGSRLWAKLRKLVDERAEPRAAGAGDAVLSLRGRDHRVRVSNLSPTGAMVEFADDAVVGEPVTLRLLDREARAGQVRWVRDGQVGIHFVASATVAGAA